MGMQYNNMNNFQFTTFIRGTVGGNLKKRRCKLRKPSKESGIFHSLSNINVLFY